MAEESAQENNSKKRDRDDSAELESTPPELKRVHPVSCSKVKPLESKRVDTGKVSDSSESTSPRSSGGEIDSMAEFPLESSIPEDILDILGDADTMPAIQDLDSVIRSFEEEILQPSPSSASPVVVGVRSDSGEYQPDLGYLLEASDDELGLPPTVSTFAEQTLQEPTDPYPRNPMVDFENELSTYDSFGFELGEIDGKGNNGDGGFVTVDGLFDYAEQSEFSDFAWPPESLPAS